MTVLIFKASHETSDESEDPYVIGFKNAGFGAETIDVIDFEYINQDSLKNKIQHPEEYGGLILTSPRSVVAVKQSISDDLKETMWSKLPSYVVGETTLNVLQHQLRLSGVGESSGNAESLASFICKDVAGNQIKPLLFPCAEGRRDILPRTLEANNIPIEIVASYRSIPHPDLERRLVEKLSSHASDLDIFVFFSPSGVGAVVPILENLGMCGADYKMVAIGPSTEQALTRNGFQVFARAAKPSPSSLVECIKSAFSERKLS